MAQVRLQSLQQGSRLVREFRETAPQVPDWPKAVKVQLYYMGLSIHMVEKVLIQDNPKPS